MPKDFVLVATIGASDIQVVHGPEGTDGTPRRFRLRRGHERSFHQACLDEEFPVQMLPLQATLSVERARWELGYDPDQRRLSSGLTEEDADIVEIDCASGITLCSPILAELADLLHQRQEQNRLGRARAVLLLTTRRSAGPFAAQEPIAAAALLRPCLAQAFQIPEPQVQEQVFLKDSEELYDEDKAGQQHLSCAAARRIDEAILELRQCHPNTRLIISDVGGLPEVKPVLAASARYRFDQHLQFLRRGETAGQRAVRRVIIPPSESLTTRYQVSQLIQGGALDAAARLAGAVEAAQQEKEPWRRWLIETVRFLNGDLSTVQGDSRLPWPDESCMRRLVEQIAAADPALRVAFRVESALRASDWPAALRESFNFFDISRLARVRKELSNRRSRRCIDADGHSFYPKLVRKALQHRLPRQWKAKQCIPVSGERGHKANGLTKIVKLFRADRLADVAQLHEMIEPLRPLRNREAHTGLREQDIQELRRLAEGLPAPSENLRGGLDHSPSHPAEVHEEGPATPPLWSTGNPRFLANPAVQAILQKLGVPEPAALYDGLIEAIDHDMDAFSFRECKKGSDDDQRKDLRRR